jgi:hypothetical protein
MQPMPQTLTQHIHDVLRNWNTIGLETAFWQELRIVNQRIFAQAIPNPGAAVRDLLLEALDSLGEQTGIESAQILPLRFLEGLTAEAAASRLNLTQDIAYKQQRAAIEKLAALVWQKEMAARKEHARHVALRLEIQEPATLFGVGEKLADLVSALTGEASPWVVAIVGIGGIGKTSLADAAIRRLSEATTFADIAWVSAHQERFTPWNGLQPSPDSPPALTFEALLDSIVEQFGFQDLQKVSFEQKEKDLCVRFKTRPYLVVVDNLETAADYGALVPNLQALTHPSKFLLTSRRRLYEFPRVHNLDLDELSALDSLSLMRHEAANRGLTSLIDVPDKTLLEIYGATGGNPLALKLVVGLLSSLSLPRVVADLRQARGRSVEDLYRFIYWRSWQVLDAQARQVLIVMPLVAESGGGPDQIATLSQVEGERLTDALRQLVHLSLVNVRGPVEERRYSIHRLTETFLLNEVIKWQAMS